MPNRQLPRPHRSRGFDPGAFNSRAARLAERLADRFRFEDVIGHSLNATVFRVHNLRLQRPEALKLLSEWSLADPDFAARFILEARLAASLTHPGIVDVYDFADTDGLLWYSMRLIDGPDLAATLATCGPLAPVTVAQLCVPILDALAYSHARGVVHRDIKPSNIFLDSSGRPYLADFGVAKAAASVYQTQAGQVLGTPAYVAPEQAQGRPVDGRTDLYGLGVTLYELLTGGYPFATGDALQSIVLRLTTDPEPLLEKRPDVPPRLAALVMRALEREPGKRFANAEAMRAEATAIDRELRGEAAGGPSLMSLAELWAKATAAGRRSERQLELRQTEALGGAPRSRVRRVGAWVGGILAVAALTAGGILAARGALWPKRGAEAPTGVPSPRAAPTAMPEPTPRPAADEVAAPAAATAGAGGRGSTEARPVAAPARSVRGSELDLEASGPGPPVRMPRLVERTPPELDESLLESCQGMIVSLTVEIGADGAVGAAHPLGAARAECVEAALAAVRQYRYEPAVDREGRPVSATVAVAIEF